MKNCMKPTFKGRLQVIGMSRLLSGVCRIQIVLALLIFIPASVDAMDSASPPGMQNNGDSMSSESDTERLIADDRMFEKINEYLNMNDNYK